MSGLKREDRYIVIKKSDLVACSGDIDPGTGMSEAEVMLRNHMESWDIPTRNALVIEADWPEYPIAWGMIEQRMTGAQASAAPEQEAVAWRRLEADDNETAGWNYYAGKVAGGKPLYTHPSAEIERLRAENKRLQKAAQTNWNEFADRNRLDVEQKLAEAQALLRESFDELDKGPSSFSKVTLRNRIHAAISSTAQPAAEQSAGVDDGTCPECEGADLGIYGPCRECGGVGTFEAALRRNHSAEGQNDE